MAFLPISKEDLQNENIQELDFIYVSGDAYVDHPSFGHAIITRIIESQGFSVGVIAQPMCDADYLKLGTPKIAFFIGSGVVDSMVNNYTSRKRKRSEDVYSEGGIKGKRPDRALMVYCKNLKKLFPDTPLIIGGIEASLRRLGHYDYWQDKVLPSILVDTNADLLMFGMGEISCLEILKYAKKGIPLKHLYDIEGTAYRTTLEKMPKKIKEELTSQANYIVIPSLDEIKKDKMQYVNAFNVQEHNTDNLNSKGIIQKNNEFYIVQNKPSRRMTEKELDFVYALPYERTFHPSYKLGVPSIKEVEFSVNSHRGCFGNCAFCALTYHQGRAVQHRSEQSILDEVSKLTKNKNFKGYIHDIGGPTANFYNPSCDKQLKCGICQNRQCIGTQVCPNLKVDHQDYLNILRKAREIKGVKKVFIRSGIRFDYLMYDKDKTFFEELCQHHISGQLKIAPEHICDNVLDFMNKPHNEVYRDFIKLYNDYNDKLGKKQFLVPYFISSHPGCNLNDAIQLAQYIKSLGYMPQQVQDFYPTPSTRATTAYYTGINPATLKPIYVAKDDEERRMQRALMQFQNPENYDIVKKALIKANREDLIGDGKNCLIKSKDKTKNQMRSKGRNKK